MKILDFIVCDDVRQELANKISIVGIYNDKIEIQVKSGTQITWPIAMKLGTYVRFQFEGDDPHFDGIEVTYTLNGKLVAKAGNNQINLGQVTSIGTFVSVAQYFPLAEEGELKFSVDFLLGAKPVKSFPDLAKIKISVRTV